MEMLYVAVLVSVLALCHCQKDIMIENTTYVEITATGIKMMASKQENIVGDKNALTVELKGLKQKNETDYLKTATFPEAKMTNSTDIAADGEVPASKQVTSTLNIAEDLSATVKLRYDVFTADGSLSRGDEKIPVMKGDVKVSVEIAGYTFPGDAQMLELSLAISGSETAKMKDGANSTYTLGGGGMVKLSEKEMEGPSSYVDVMPNMDGNMAMVIFNKTSGKIEYSVVLMLADVSTAEVTTPKPSSCTRVTSLGVIVWFLLIVHRILW